VAKRYVIQKIGLRSAGKLGLALGMLGSLLPACLLALLTRLAVTGVRQAYEAAAQARFSVLARTSRSILLTWRASRRRWRRCGASTPWAGSYRCWWQWVGP
jgi:hypothetical protein